MEKFDNKWIRTNFYIAGNSSEKLKPLYDEWSKRGYDNFAAPKDKISGRTLLVKTLSDIFPESIRTNLKIFDVAAGTGLLGKELQKNGFIHIDALDYSPGMLEIAEQTGIYERLICDCMSDKRLDMNADTYDVLTSYAGIAEGHIPWSALPEMVRVVKPGGIIALGVNKQLVFTTTKTFGEELESFMKKLEEGNKWKQIRKETYSNHLFDYDGVLYLFKVN